ncbi:hypothetical protein [Moraxella oblonga]|uniref:hypothetical protein n=1 Tax=Moraxella oblonga TaxID=200413 RepID=UPI000829E85C|nr:hypothetical protein [Moraxella oblonga]
MKVIFADWLKQNFLSLDEVVRLAIVDFAVHVEENGVRELQGRNKSSILPNPTTKKEYKHAKFAQKYCLWHYHLGIPEYIEQRNGDKTSEYILHYCYYHDVIVLVDIGTHPPFSLPSVDKMNYSTF